MDNIEASGKTREKQVNDLTAAQKQLANLEKPFGFGDVLKITVWTIVLFLLLRALVVRDFMDTESDRELTKTACFNVFLFLGPLVISAMAHFAVKREEKERLKNKIKLLTQDDDPLPKQEEASDIPPKANQADEPKRIIPIRRLVWGFLQLVGALIFLGFLILLLIGMLAATIDFFDPDIFQNSAIFQNDTVQFFMALFQVAAFFGGLFLVIFTLVIGGHAAISKDPIEKNLSHEVLKKRFKHALVYILFRILSHYYIEYRLKKIRDWWHKKS